MIIAAAILAPDGTCWVGTAGQRHHHIIKAIVMLTGIKAVTSDYTQGFLADCGCFLDREAAMKHALKAQQLKPTASDLLFSEDLW